jgi:hypothetical protein
MPKNKRKDATEGSMPLIAFEEVTSEKESFKLSWTVMANIREYVSYVKDVTGRETTRDEVVDKGMQRLFDADKGFRQWLQKKTVKEKSEQNAKRLRRMGKLGRHLSLSPKPNRDVIQRSSLSINSGL